MSLLSLARARSTVEQGAVFGIALLLMAAAVPLRPCLAAGNSSLTDPYAVPFLGAAFIEGQGFLAQRKWAEAVIAFRSVLKHSPESIPATLGLARALVFSGRREEALGILVRAAEGERKRNREVLVRRANVLSRVFLTNGTFQIFQDGLDLLIAGKYRLARERFDRALEQEPDNVEILLRLGQAMVLDQDHDSAAERLRLARRLNPFEPLLSLWLGRALHERGEHREAVSELRSAYAELPDSELCAVWLANAMMSSGQRPGAIRILEENVKRSPFHLNALVELARFRMILAGREEQGIWAARKDLQVALSRYESQDEAAKNVRRDVNGYELTGVVWAKDLKAEMLKLMQQVDAKDSDRKKSKPADQ